MYNVVKELRLNKYVILSLDRPITEKAYFKVFADGAEYGIIPMYDFPGIAIESPDSFLGKTISLG